MSEAVQGDRIIKSLEIAAKHVIGVHFKTTPVTTHLSSIPGSALRIHREPTLLWRDMTIHVSTSNSSDIAAIELSDHVIFDYGRELAPEDQEAFGEVLRALESALEDQGRAKHAVTGSTAKKTHESPSLARQESGQVAFSADRKYRILALVHGEFGKRKVKNIRENGPSHWIVNEIELPVDLPSVIDDPSEYLQKEVPQADLLLALQENANAAQLIVDYVRLAGARALQAPVDNSEWLPEGQRNQIKRQLRALGVECSFPRPFCVFEESGNVYLDEFAGYFGKPVFKIQWERDNVTEVRIIRGAPCGCSAFVADKLKGVRVDESPEVAGLAHHHYPCLASMTREPDIDDTLMHKSGFKTKEAVDKEIEPYKKKHASYLDPSGLK